MLLALCFSYGQMPGRLSMGQAYVATRSSLLGAGGILIVIVAVDAVRGGT